MKRVLEGQEDFQYVEVAARFKSVCLVDNVHLRIVLESQGQTLEAIVSTEDPTPDWPAGMPVFVRGVVSVFRDAEGHSRSGRLHVFQLTDVRPAGPAPAPVPAAANPGPGLTLLTNVAQIKRLSAEQAAQRYPVRVQAVLNMFSVPARTAFIQDSTGGIFVTLSQAPPPFLDQGTEVEVEGVSHPGDFAPSIHAATMRVLSPGDLLPPVEIATPLRIAARDENKWARIKGVARRALSLANSGIQIDLEVDGQHFPVNVLGDPSPATYSHWIDAELEIEGVLGALFDQNRQLQGFHLIAPSEKFVKVTLPPPAEPFARTASPLGSLFQMRLEDASRHRVKVAGTVSAARLGGSVYIAAGDASLRLRARGASTARAGDRVEAVGFLPLGVKLPVLEEAEVRVLGKGSAEPLAETSAEDLMTGAMDTRLVRLEAHLVGQRESYGDEVLTLQAGKTVFTAVLEQPQPFPELEALRPGSMLRLTGVCDVTWDVTRTPPEPVSFRLLLRSPSDIAVVQMASWWTARNTLGVLASMCALVIIVLAWVFVLQRRVNKQTAMLAAKLEYEKQLQEQLSQAQRLESVGRLAGGVAHDFNNLLTVINGYSELALARLNAADPLRTSLEQIRRAGERAAVLTQQLLGFSRKQIIQPKPVNLNAVVTDARGMLQPLLGELIQVHTTLEPELGQVVADTGQIDQILMNLAANARDAMPRGGTLTIETCNIDVGTRRGDAPAQIPPGAYVMLTVTDTGSGMSEAIRKQVFEPFFTTKAVGSGTGLGLATVYGIVKQNRGWIDVQSEIGTGTTFHIWLPRLSGDAVTKSAVVPQAATRDSERLLVVDDQEDVRKFAVEVLESHGYSVLSAADAESALALMERHPDSIHLLVTDVVLPGINGRDLAQRLRASRPAMQVLFTSGYSQDVIAASGVLDPGVSYIAKPYTPGELATKVKEMLAGTPGSSK
jgi:signal transduction histidine kinase/ActR/RegA family two-component response regulator